MMFDLFALRTPTPAPDGSPGTGSGAEDNSSPKRKPQARRMSTQASMKSSGAGC